MEACKYVLTSSPATAKNQLTINDLDDDTLGMIFNKLPYIERLRIGSVCQRWGVISKCNWCIYTKCLTFDKDLLYSFDMKILKKKKSKMVKKIRRILKKIMQLSGPYLEEFTFALQTSFYTRFEMGTIKWITELCPKLKRLNAEDAYLNDDDWLACRNLEALNLHSESAWEEIQGYNILFRNNKRLRRLKIHWANKLSVSWFDHLDSGQLEFLHLEDRCNFYFTAELADKLGKSLVALRYKAVNNSRELEHFGKIKTLRSLDLTLSQIYFAWLTIDVISNFAQNCQRLEYLFLVISAQQTFDPNDFFAPLFNMPYLRRLVIIVQEHNAPSENQRDRLLQRAAQLEHFVIETCAECQESYICDRHPRLQIW